MARRVEEDSGFNRGRLRELANGLLDGGPPARWWPYDRPLDIALSAILTQRTKWANAARAMENLKEAGLLDAAALARARRRAVEACVRPTGFYRQKARAVQAVGTVLVARFGGSVERLFDLEDLELRAELLTWRGVGPETADAIMLYAARRPVFVVDAYTERLQKRFGAVAPLATPSYAETSAAWSRALGRSVPRLQAVHGAIVDHCKSVCTASPDCVRCELADRCAQRVHERALNSR